MERGGRKWFDKQLKLVSYPYRLISRTCSELATPGIVGRLVLEVCEQIRCL